MSEGKIEFFPLLQALCLDTEEDDTAQQLESLRTMVTSVLDRFKEEVRKISSQAPPSFRARMTFDPPLSLSIVRVKGHT